MLDWIDQLYREALAAAASTDSAEATWLRQAGGILLYGSIGVEAVLRPDGSVWTYGADNPMAPDAGSSWREVTGPERWGALLLGTKRYPRVAELLPKQPPGARDCSVCKGTGYVHRDATGRGVVCPECGGLGWKPL